MKTERGREIMERRKLLYKKLQQKKIREKQQQEMIETWKALIKIHPKVSRLNKSLIALLKETENLVISLSEPLYLVEMEDSKELVICKGSDLKPMGGRNYE